MRSWIWGCPRPASSRLTRFRKARRKGPPAGVPGPPSAVPRQRTPTNGAGPAGAGGDEARGAGGRRIEDILSTGQSVLVQVVREPLAPKGLQGQLRSESPGTVFRFPSARPERGDRQAGNLGPARTVAAGRPRRTPRDARGAMGGAQHGGTARRRDARHGHRPARADWAEIRGRERFGPPACLRAEVPMVFRFIRDVLSSGFDAIRVDSETLEVRKARQLHPPVPSRNGAPDPLLLPELSDLRGVRG